MRRTRLTIAATLVASAGLVGLPSAASAAPGAPSPDVPVQFLTLNDLHGRIATPLPNNRDGQLTLDGESTLVGGAANIATVVDAARASFVADGGAADSSALIGLGDLVGASPFESAAFRDESTLEVLDAMGMAVSVVGNHEFDRGTDELRRLSGATDGTFTDGVTACEDVELPSAFCFEDSTGADFAGTDFPFLAANVVVKGTTTPMLPPYAVLDVGGGQQVGLIGVVTETTDTIVAPTGIADVDFLDEAEAINRYVPELQAQGVEAIVALVHEGGTPSTPTDIAGCGTLTGPIVDINNRTDAAVDIVLSAHTHQNYSCYLTDPAGQPRLVAQAGYYGRELGDIRFVIDGETGDVDRLCGTYTATNIPVLQAVPDDPAIAEIVDYWVSQAAIVGSVEVGTTPTALERAKNAAGSEDRSSESVLGNTIAEAQLAALAADSTYSDTAASFNGGVPAVALMNPGGLRADINAGSVTYAEAFTVQPFGNYVNAVTLTGEQLRLVIEQQFSTPGRSSQLWLGTSEGFSYDYDLTRPAYDRVNPASLSVDGVAVLPTDTIRVVANSFLAGGGDSFTALTLGTTPVTGPVDVDTFIDYLGSSAFAPGTLGHGSPQSGWSPAELTPPAGGGGGDGNGGDASATGPSGALGVTAAGYTCPAEPTDPSPTDPTATDPGTQPIANPGNGIGTGYLADTGAVTGQLTAVGVGLLLTGGLATVAGYRRGRGTTD